MKKLFPFFIAIIFLDVASAFCQITTFHGAERPPLANDGWGWWGYMEGNSVAKTPDGRFVVGGAIDVSRNLGRPYLLKTPISGASEWHQVYLAKRNSYSGRVQSVREYDAGSVVATGHVSVSSGIYNILLIKMDRYGNTLLTKNFRLGGYDCFGNCIQVVKKPG